MKKGQRAKSAAQGHGTGTHLLDITQCIGVLTDALTNHTRSAQARPSHQSVMVEEELTVPTDELLATDGLWEMESRRL